MILRSSRPYPIQPSEITPEAIYLDRRRFMRGAAWAAAGLALGESAAAAEPPGLTAKLPWPITANRDLAGAEKLTPWTFVTHYNNYYEFGTDKEDPAKKAHTLKVRPWSVAVEGECEAPGVVDLEDLVKPQRLEERIYRLRCVEGWSMVIPWTGFALADLLKAARPTSKARYVAFTTLADRAQMPGVRPSVIDWPYREGLRIDEAMHPLAILAVGLYGHVLPNQNGAPLRLVVPWKYGFKSIKSIVRIRFTERQPSNSWNTMDPREYGFYSNVNPDVKHPRWSQKTERRIGEWFKRPSLMFNGYPEVGSLYTGMDLRTYF